MKRKISFLLVVLFILITLLQAEEKTKKWTLSVEAGAGTLVSLMGSYLVKEKLDLGIGGGFDYNKFTVGDSKYDSLLLNVNVFAGYRILSKDRIEIQARLKPGFDYLKVGSFSTTCFELTPELLAGYFNLYAVASGIIMFTKDIAFVPQIGVGYRFRF